jgi:hypothetical protein
VTSATAADDMPAASGPDSPRLRALHALDVIDLPRPAAIIDGVAYAGCITVGVGESGAGKTFVFTDLAAAVSAGLPWHGRATRSGSVVYVQFEGDAMGLRLRALRDVAGYRLEHLYVIRAGEPVSPRLTRDGEEHSLGECVLREVLSALTESLAGDGRPPIVLVIVDTIRASMTGSEDSSEHVSAYLRSVRRIMATMPGAACILVHHAGWQDGDTARKRERGSSAWRGNCDVTLYIEAGEFDADRGETLLTVRTLKIRDAEKPGPLHLVRRRVELLEMDDYGDPVTSCIIDRDRRTRQDREAEAAALINAEQREMDLRTLRAIHERPDLATSCDRLRSVLGGRKTALTDSLHRLVAMGWALPGKRNQPYTVTSEGLLVLSGPTVPNGSGQFRGTVPNGSPVPPLWGPGTVQESSGTQTTSGNRSGGAPREGATPRISSLSGIDGLGIR